MNSIVTKISSRGAFSLLATVLVVVGALSIMPNSVYAQEYFGDFSDSGCCEYYSGSYDLNDYYSGSYDTSSYYSGSYDLSDYYSGSYDMSDYYSGSYDMSDYYSGSYDTSDYFTGSYDNSDYFSGSYDNESTYWKTTSITDSYAPDTYWNTTSVTDSYTPDTYWNTTSVTDSYVPSYSYNNGYSYSMPYSSSYTTSSMAQPISWSKVAIGGGSYNISHPINVGKSSSYYYPVQYYPQNPVPSCSIIASPSQVNQGGTSTLIWSSANATSASISNGIGAVSLSGSRSVTVNGYITYVMTVTGPGGTSNCQTTITVTQNPPQALWCTIQANPSFINYGNSSTLTWNSSGATSATLSGTGNVSVNGSQTVSPSSSTTYTLTVYGQNGQSANCQTTINVGQIQQNLYCTLQNAQPYGTYYGNYYGNQAVTLSWTSQGATSAFLTNVGNVSVNGSTTVYPTSNMTYTLTVYGANGQSANCQTTVNGYQPPVVGNLYCTLTANPSTVQNGNGSVLSWTSYGATSAFLSDGLGYQQVNGSLTVRPETNRTYTLTVYNGQGQSAVCSTNVNVSGQYVALTQIPYTGFDLGPVGNALYFLGLLVLAGGAAYFALSFNGGIMAVAGSFLAPRAKTNYQPSIVHETTVAKKAAAPVVAEEPVITQKTVFAPATLPTSTTTKDSVVASTDANGTPRLVISRN